MEDTQNSAPETLEATKLSGAGQRGDTQSVTKRYEVPPSRVSLLAEVLTCLGSIV
jgi:hypothetical protein